MNLITVDIANDEGGWLHTELCEKHYNEWVMDADTYWKLECQHNYPPQDFCDKCDAWDIATITDEIPGEPLDPEIIFRAEIEAKDWERHNA
jgi:hypothetical protein